MRAGVQAGLPLPYRSQAKAVMPPAEELEAVPKGACRAVLMRSRMLRSMCTTAETLPHFGLGLPGYVQVTSPIRRYADLAVHRVLHAFLAGKRDPADFPTAAEMAELCGHINTAARTASGTRRSSSPGSTLIWSGAKPSTRRARPTLGWAWSPW